MCGFRSIWEVNAAEREDDSGVEFECRPFDKMPTRLIIGHCLAPRPARGERTVCIGNAENARRERYLLGLQVVGVAGTIPPFVMPANDELCAFWKLQFGDLLLADHRM